MRGRRENVSVQGAIRLSTRRHCFWCRRFDRLSIQDHKFGYGFPFSGAKPIRRFAPPRRFAGSIISCPHRDKEKKGPGSLFCPHWGKRFHCSREATRWPKGAESPLVRFVVRVGCVIRGAASREIIRFFRPTPELPIRRFAPPFPHRGKEKRRSGSPCSCPHWGARPQGGDTLLLHRAIHSQPNL